MSAPSHADAGGLGGLVSFVRWTIAAMGRMPYTLVALAARIFPAAIFWYSGRTKVDGWALKESAIALFEDQYRVPLLDPTVAAYLAAFAEHLFPILLVIGLATRFSALALLLMTLVIQIFVYPGAWPTHGVWATCFLIVIARGPGVLCLDHLIARRFR